MYNESMMRESDWTGRAHWLYSALFLSVVVTFCSSCSQQTPSQHLRQQALSMSPGAVLSLMQRAPKSSPIAAFYAAMLYSSPDAITLSRNEAFSVMESSPSVKNYSYDFERKVYLQQVSNAFSTQQQIFLLALLANLEERNGLYSDAIKRYRYIGELYKQVARHSTGNYEKLISSKMFENIFARSRSRVAIHDALAQGRRWSFKTAPLLAAAIQNDLETLNSWKMTSLKSPQFFISDWFTDPNDLYSSMQRRNSLKFTTRDFLLRVPSYPSVPDFNSRWGRRPALRYFDQGRQAYLLTTGWQAKISTWTLVFSQIVYPEDPEVNGSWEWAGVHFGEQL